MTTNRNKHVKYDDYYQDDDYGDYGDYGDETNNAGYSEEEALKQALKESRAQEKEREK